MIGKCFEKVRVRKQELLIARDMEGKTNSEFNSKTGRYT